MAVRDDLKLYVRGFFGSKNMSHETYQSRRSKPILSVFDLNPEALKHVVCNEAVVEIYNQLVRRQVISTDFDFRERAIKVALSAFGENNFQAWIKANAYSPVFSQTHADFLNDTARFIVTGKRHLPVDTWERLITASTNDPNNTISFDEALLAQLPSGFSAIHTVQTANNLHNVIAKWLSHEGGFTDMVTTLYTLFGESTGR